MFEALTAIAFTLAGISTAPATGPTSKPAFQVTEVVSYPNAGVRFAVPAGWIRRPSPHPTQLYEGSRPSSLGPRLTLMVRCEKVGDKSVQAVAEGDAAEGRRFRRAIQLTGSGDVPVGDRQFYEAAGTSYLGRQGQSFVWRYLKREDLCYSVLASAAFAAPHEQATAREAVGALADAVCASITLTEPQDPSDKLYVLSPIEDLVRFRLKMGIPEAWRWTRLPMRDPTAVVAVGLMDYLRGMREPSLVVRIEYCPPGITAEQIVEGAYRSAVADLAEGQRIERLSAGPATLAGEPAWNLVVNVLIDKPYTEARRTIVDDENRAISLIVRYANTDNPRALEMLERIADSAELLGSRQRRQPRIDPPPGIGSE